MIKNILFISKLMNEYFQNNSNIYILNNFINNFYNQWEIV